MWTCFGPPTSPRLVLLYKPTNPRRPATSTSEGGLRSSSAFPPAHDPHISECQAPRRERKGTTVNPNTSIAHFCCSTESTPVENNHEWADVGREVGGKNGPIVTQKQISRLMADKRKYCISKISKCVSSSVRQTILKLVSPGTVCQKAYKNSMLLLH